MFYSDYSAIKMSRPGGDYQSYPDPNYTKGLPPPPPMVNGQPRNFQYMQNGIQQAQPPQPVSLNPGGNNITLFYTVPCPHFNLFQLKFSCNYQISNSFSIDKETMKKIYTLIKYNRFY